MRAENAPEPMLEISEPTFCPSRALAKRVGQKGSTVTLAALSRAFSLSACMHTGQAFNAHIKLHGEP